MTERAASLPVVGGVLCLDCCNTVSGAGTPDAIEHLGSLEDLAAWSVHACVLPQAEARRIVRGTPAAVRPHVLAEALQVRSVLHELLSRVARGAAPSPSSVRAHNTRLSVVFRGPSLSASGDGFVLDFEEPPSGVDAVLAPVLRSAAETLVGKDPARLKSCPGHGCGWLFHDETKNANRVWCEMEVCGDRAKLRARRRRERASTRPRQLNRARAGPPRRA